MDTNGKKETSDRTPVSKLAEFLQSEMCELQITVYNSVKVSYNICLRKNVDVLGMRFHA